MAAGSKVKKGNSAKKLRSNTTAARARAGLRSLETGRTADVPF